MLPYAAVAGFRSRVQGSVLGRCDDGYDRARVVFNAMIERFPALIVRCAGVADVREAVMFARENDLLTSIRGGGHGVTGNAVCDEGLVIDLSRMRSVCVDPVTQTARAEGGATRRGRTFRSGDIILESDLRLRLFTVVVLRSSKGEERRVHRHQEATHAHVRCSGNRDHRTASQGV